MKKLLVIFAVLITALSLGACKKKTEETPQASVKNPWIEVSSAAELLEKNNILMDAPDGATDVVYKYLETGELSEIRFKYDNVEYCLRGSKIYSGPLELGGINTDVDAKVQEGNYMVYAFKDDTMLLEFNTDDANYTLYSAKGDNLVAVGELCAKKAIKNVTDDVINEILSQFCGDYSNGGKYVMNVSKNGDSKQLTFTITESTAADTVTEWIFAGTLSDLNFDSGAENYQTVFKYDNALKRIHTINEKGEIVKTEDVYNNGTGTISISNYIYYYIMASDGTMDPAASKSCITWLWHSDVEGEQEITIEDPVASQLEKIDYLGNELYVLKQDAQ